MWQLVCVSQSPCFWSDTLVRMCTCISTWIYVHLTTHVFSTPMHSLMKTWVPMCGSVFVSQSPPFCSHTLFRIFPCISTWIYVHLTTHVFSTPMHSLMKTWVPMCGSVFVFQSPHFCSHTLFRIFPCISTWIYVHLTAHVCSIPYA